VSHKILNKGTWEIICP